MLAFFVLGNAKVLSFALGNAKIARRKQFCVAVEYRLKRTIRPTTLLVAPDRKLVGKVTLVHLCVRWGEREHAGDARPAFRDRSLTL